MWNMPAMPLPGSPISSPTQGESAPSTGTVLTMPRLPILWLMPDSVTPLRSPRLPSSLTRYFGTRNSEIPRVPEITVPSGCTILASTMCRMFSDSSWSPPEIHILLPLRW